MDIKELATIGIMLLRNEKPYTYCIFTENEDGTIEIKKKNAEENK